MMYPKSEYKFIKFEQSPIKFKKYRAILQNKKNNKMVHIDFGDSRYEQYRDSTGLNLYSHKDHNDIKRRNNYRARHSVNSIEPYSANYFSFKYLW